MNKFLFDNHYLISKISKLMSQAKLFQFKTWSRLLGPLCEHIKSSNFGVTRRKLNSKIQLCKCRPLWAEILWALIWFMLDIRFEVLVRKAALKRIDSIEKLVLRPTKDIWAFSSTSKISKQSWSTQYCRAKSCEAIVKFLNGSTCCQCENRTREIVRTNVDTE